MTHMRTTNAPPRLPALRIGLECGLVNLSVRDSAGIWHQLQVIHFGQAVHFLRTLGYKIPLDIRVRIAAGGIVTLLGDSLRAAPKAEGGRPTKIGTVAVPVSPPTIADLGISKKLSAEAQTLAKKAKR